MGNRGLCAHYSTQANNGSYAIPARGQLWDLVVASATLRAGTPLPARPACMNGSTVAAIPERKVAGAVLRVLGLACHGDGACFASKAAAGHPGGEYFLHDFCFCGTQHSRSPSPPQWRRRLPRGRRRMSQARLCRPLFPPPLLSRTTSAIMSQQRVQRTNLEVAAFKRCSRERAASSPGNLRFGMSFPLPCALAERGGACDRLCPDSAMPR